MTFLCIYLYNNIDWIEYYTIYWSEQKNSIVAESLGLKALAIDWRALLYIKRNFKQNLVTQAHVQDVTYYFYILL